jgi:hypothetical protein
MRVQTAIRAWVEVERGDSLRAISRATSFRSARIGEKVWIFDTETSTDLTQRLLYGFFRVYANDALELEAIFYHDNLAVKDLETISRFARRENLRMFSRSQFVDLFYAECYELGTLCVGANLPFDLSRIAIHAGVGRGRNRRKFRFTLSENPFQPKLRVEAISGKGAFITFAIKNEPDEWRDKGPVFPGRFLDVLTLARAFTGEHHTLYTAGLRFGALPLKTRIETLGIVTPETLAYGRNDVHATWALYEKLREEYAHHPFASFENERNQPAWALPITRILSSASIAKQYMKMMGFAASVRDDSEAE